MTMYIDRARYETTSFSFTGLPETMIAGDAAPEDTVVFTVEVHEDLIDDFRRSVRKHSFWCDLHHGEYTFEMRDCQLAAPLPDRDYGTHKVQIVFKVLRRNIVRCIRPMGQPKRDPAEIWHRQLHVYGSDLDRLRRKRIALAKNLEELELQQRELDQEDSALQNRRAALWESGTPELCSAAEARGF